MKTSHRESTDTHQTAVETPPGGTVDSRWIDLYRVCRADALLFLGQSLT